MAKRHGGRRTTSRSRSHTVRDSRWWQRLPVWVWEGPGQPEMVGLALLVSGAWMGAVLIWNLPGHLFLHQLCGWGAYPLAIALLAGGLLLLFYEEVRQHWRWELLVGLELAWLGSLTLTQLVSPGDNPLEGTQRAASSGLIGWAVGSLLGWTFGQPGAWVIALAATLLGLWLIWHSLPWPMTAPVAAHVLASLRQTWGRALSRVQMAWTSSLDNEDELDERIDTVEGPSEGEAVMSPSPPELSRHLTSRKPGGRWPARARPVKPLSRPKLLPPLDLLVPDEGTEVSEAAARDKANLIERTLASFGVPARVVAIHIGPTVTQFGVEPLYIERQGLQRKVRVSRIQALANDLALALAAPSIRIEAPVPGRPYVGIEVPNAQTALVNLRGVLESPEFQRLRSPLAIALGRDVSGAPVVADLERMPHLLIAGATGSGKSVCVHTIITSLLLNNGPDRLRLLMVDPKMVELVGYNGIPHLLGPVVTDLKQVVGALVWMTLQMDERYRRFNAAGVRNLEAYNRKMAKRVGEDGPLPYIVVVIDELADLMMTAPEEVERHICRLAQMARATGIHLVIATQRPSVDVITGLIKANFPARIAFAVASGVDSRVILDQPGAEKLLGRGDMLFMAPQSSKLQRIQGCFVSDQEIRAVVDFWRQADWEKPLVSEAVTSWTGLLDELDERDDLIEQALRELQGVSYTSASMLQRRLRIGYPRAARLIEQLEEMGVIGPDEGVGRPRRVLLSSSSRQSEEDDSLLER